MKPLRLAAALTAFLFFAPALASADDRALCDRPGSPRDARIEACNRILSGDLNDRERALVLVSRGLAYWVMDRERAIADLEAAIALQPDLARAWWARGYFHRYSRDIRNEPELRQRIIADFSRAIELAPNEVEYYYHRALMYSGYEKDYERAIADYSRMIELNPRHIAAYDSRARAYGRLGDFQRQIADLSQLVNITNGRDAYIARGMGYLNLKDYEKAEADFIEAQRRDPFHPSPLSGLAHIYTARGEFTQALALYDRAIKQAPHLSWLYEGRARTFIAMREYEKALADAERSLKIFRVARAFNLRAEIYEAMGRREDAIADFRTALALNHGPQESAVSRAALERLGVQP